MADALDMATQVEERDRELALKMRNRGPVIVATGKCLCCDTPLPTAQRWCDADCRDVWQSRHPRR